MVARTSGHCYDISEFIVACGTKDAVLVWPSARKDAKEQFSLFYDSLVLGVIANDGLPDRQFDNSAPLENGPPQDIGKPVDAYVFSMGPKFVYIAFYKNFKNKWIIKSFHLPEHGERVQSLSYNPFALLRNFK